MANSKQQIKRAKTNEKRRQQDVMIKSSLKRTIAMLKRSVEENNKEAATELLQTAYKKLDKALAKGIYHQNFVARNKSSLATLVNSL